MGKDRGCVKEMGNLTSWQLVLEHLNKRDAQFLALAEQIAIKKCPYWGWVKYWETVGGSHAKRPSNLHEQGSIFSGSNWCTVSCILIKRALEEIAPSVDVKILSFFVDVNAELWRRHGYGPANVGHNILWIGENNNGVYVDPTYGQIYEAYIGKFAIIKPELFLKFYGNVPRIRDVTWESDVLVANALRNGRAGVMYKDLLPLVELLKR